MRLPNIKRILLEDFPTEQAWIGKLILPLNDFMQNVINIVNSNVSLKDNILSQTKVLKINGSTTVTGDIVAGSQTIFNPSSLVGLVPGLTAKGLAISSLGVTILSVFSTEFTDTANTNAIGTPTVTGLASTTNYVVGQPITGPGIPLNTVVLTVVNNTTITLDKNLIGGGGVAATITLGKGIRLSQTLKTSAIGSYFIFGGNFPLYIQKTITTRPAAVLVASVIESSANPAILTYAPYADWTFTSDQIIINNITGLIADKVYTVTFIILGE